MRGVFNRPKKEPVTDCVTSGESSWASVNVTACGIESSGFLVPNVFLEAKPPWSQSRSCCQKSPLADTSGRIISAGGSQRCRRRRRALRPEVFTETAGDTNATPGPLTSQMLQNTAGDFERPMASFFLCWRRGGRIMFCFLSHRTTLKWTSLHKTGQDFFFPGCLGSFNTKRSLDCTWKRQHSSWGGIGSGCCLWDIWGLFHVTEH